MWLTVKVLQLVAVCFKFLQYEPYVLFACEWLWQVHII